MTELKYIFHKVVCDETNNTQEDIENQVVNVDIYVEIISPIEKIITNITATEVEPECNETENEV
jgi:phage tail sheath protein FI